MGSSASKWSACMARHFITGVQSALVLAFVLIINPLRGGRGESPRLFNDAIALVFAPGVFHVTLSTPGVFLPSFSVTRLTAIALPLNEWVSNHCQAFTLLCLPPCVAFTIRVCSRLT